MRHYFQQLKHQTFYQLAINQYCFLNRNYAEVYHWFQGNSALVQQQFHITDAHHNKKENLIS